MMCVVTTAAAGTAATAALANASLALGAMGAALSAYSSYQSGKSQEAQASALARQAEADARTAREEGMREEARIRRNTAQTLGAQKADFAAKGVDISDPDASAANILGDTAQWGDYDARLARHQGEVEAAGLRSKSNAYAVRADTYARAATIGAGTSLLSGARQVAGKWYGYMQ